MRFLYVTAKNKTACQTSPCKCKIFISSIESDVYNKKKIQMFVVNMTFISSREVTKCIFHSCLRHSWNMKYTFFHFTRWNKSHIHSARMKYTFFHFTRCNKSHIHDKHLNILYIFEVSLVICNIRYLICKQWINRHWYHFLKIHT